MHRGNLQLLLLMLAHPATSCQATWFQLFPVSTDPWLTGVYRVE